MSYTRKMPCRGWGAATDTPKLCLSFPSPVDQDREPPYLCSPVILLGDGLVPLLAGCVPAKGQQVSATTHGMSLAGLSPYLGWGDSNRKIFSLFPPGSNAATHQICIRTLIPSTSMVFILKSTPGIGMGEAVGVSWCFPL